MRTIAPLLAALTLVNARQDCACGHVVNATDQEYYAVFTEIFEADFLHVSDLREDTSNCTTPKQARGPYGKASRVENVRLNPLNNAWDWAGPSIHDQDQDPGLQLWTKQDLIAIPGSDDSMISMAEVVSTRDDMLYGSFRIGLKTTAVNGTCGAFFFYLNDTQEIDMDFLSKSHQKSSGFVHLVIESDETRKTGADSPDIDAHSLFFSPTVGYNEFRFDWLPDRVDFYANGERLRTITENIPETSGSLHIIHWSNGNDGWSAGPPKEDAVMTVNYVEAYFNSSEPDNTEASLMRCLDSLSGEHACRVPDQLTPPNPLGPNGNQTAQTYFFSRDMGALIVTPAPMPPRHHPTSGSERRFGSGNGSVLYWTMAITAGLFTFHGFDMFRLLHVGLRIRAP